MLHRALYREGLPARALDKPSVSMPFYRETVLHAGKLRDSLPTVRRLLALPTGLLSLLQGGRESETLPSGKWLWGAGEGEGGLTENWPFWRARDNH